MKLILSQLFFSFFIFSYQQIKAQCYVKCEIPAKYSIREIVLPVFTGDVSKVNPSQLEELKMQEVPTDAGDFNKNLKTKNKRILPNELYIVRDTNAIKQYELHRYQITELTEKKRVVKKHPVVCMEDITPSLVTLIKSSLSKSGYYLGKVDGEINDQLEKGLVEFQKANSLPNGILDFETLDALKISY